MRKSDEKKNPFLENHDQQIGGVFHDKIMLWLYAEVSRDFDLVKTITGISVKPKNIEKQIEAPIYKNNYNGRSIIGFADLRVTAEEHRLFTEAEMGKAQADKDKEWFEYMKRIKFETKPHQGFVEVKSKVNIGETIRQIRYYQQMERQRWSVCAPAFSESHILVEQGINFIAYPGEDFF